MKIVAQTVSLRGQTDSLSYIHGSRKLATVYERSVRLKEVNDETTYIDGAG
jgi:hypothetical protein